MSKQLKYKFKKTLKKADFLHADLEFHQEIIVEAQTLFQTAIQEIIQAFPEEIRDRLTGLIQQEKDEQIRTLLKKEPPQKAFEEPIEENDVIREPEDIAENVKEVTLKDTSLKKIFHKIAEITHPDKACSRGTHPQEVRRLENLFKIATDAYHAQNWYTLYSLALSLNIEVEDLSDKHVEWIEDEIRKTLSNITAIENLLPWIWYHGEEHIKYLALQDYFRQVFNFNYAVPSD